MKKDVIIQIVGRQQGEDGEDTIEMTTVGTLDGGPDDYLLTYMEQDEEMEGCVTTLRVQGGRTVTMTRAGSYETQLTIEQNKRHNCHYSTPYGDLVMGVFAKEVTSRMTNGGGKLHFHYTIDFNAGLAAVNELTVTVKEAAPGCLN